jgi:hypothetical protein
LRAVIAGLTRNPPHIVNLSASPAFTGSGTVSGSPQAAFLLPAVMKILPVQATMQANHTAKHAGDHKSRPVPNAD